MQFRHNLFNQEVPERDPAQARVAIGNRIKSCDRGGVEIGPLAIGRKDRPDCIRNLAQQSDFNKDQWIVRHRGVEKGKEHPVRITNALAQIIPVSDFVNRLVSDDLFQNLRRG